jgi:hypothetical protein
MTELGEQLFEERSEHVYFLRAESTQTFVEGVGAHLDVSFFANHALDELPAHYITTLYFDTDTQEIARACEGGTEGVRVRAREYYDRLPEQGIRREPLLWLEVKTRSGAVTRKLRFAIPSHEVDAVLRDGMITEMLNLDARVWGPSAAAVLHEIGQLCMHAAGPLEPDCVAHYRRQAWEDADGTLRITLDTELAFHRPPAHPFQGGRMLAEALGEPVARLGHTLIEIKSRREPPAWLRNLIAQVGLEPALEGPGTFSKFVAASHAVHCV